MTDFESTLDAIDQLAIHHCGHCDTELGPEAPSGLFCDDVCQAAFYEAHSEALVGYREPTDLPQHAFNLIEERSPEVTPTVWPDDGLALALYGNAYYRVVRDEWTHDGERIIHQIEPVSFGPPFTWTMGDPVPVEFTLTVDTSRFDQAIASLGFQLDEWQRQILRQVYGRHARDIERAWTEAQASVDRALFGDLDAWRPTGRDHHALDGPKLSLIGQYKEQTYNYPMLLHVRTEPSGRFTPRPTPLPADIYPPSEPESRRERRRRLGLRWWQRGGSR